MQSNGCVPGEQAEQGNRFMKQAAKKAVQDKWRSSKPKLVYSDKVVRNSAHNHVTRLVSERLRAEGLRCGRTISLVWSHPVELRLHVASDAHGVVSHRRRSSRSADSSLDIEASLEEIAQEGCIKIENFSLQSCDGPLNVHVNHYGADSKSIDAIEFQIVVQWQGGCKVINCVWPEGKMCCKGQDLTKMVHAASIDFSKLEREGWLIDPGWIREAIQKHTHTKTLRLSGKSIIAFPGKLMALQQLEVVHLSNNSLCSLPESFCKLQKLKVLTLNNNQLSVIPVAISKLNLLRLELRGNQISAVPLALFEGLSCCLQTLDVSCNSIAELPEPSPELGSCLEVLQLAENQFTTLPQIIRSFSRLQEESTR